MSIKNKQAPGNKQQKLLACVGSYLTLLYNIHCPTGVTRSAQSHLQGAGRTSHPTSHTSTHRCSQPHSHRDSVPAGSPRDNCKCSKCQLTEERAGVQWWGARLATSPWKSISALAVAVQGLTRSAVF